MMLRELSTCALVVLVHAHDPCVGHHCNETGTSGWTIAVAVLLMLFLAGLIMYPCSGTYHDTGLQASRLADHHKQLRAQ